MWISQENDIGIGDMRQGWRTREENQEPGRDRETSRSWTTWKRLKFQDYTRMSYRVKRPK